MNIDFFTFRVVSFFSQLPKKIVFQGAWSWCSLLYFDRSGELLRVNGGAEEGSQGRGGGGGIYTPGLFLRRLDIC